MTTTQLPFAICQYCKYQWKLTDLEKFVLSAVCPRCKKRNFG